MRTNLPILTFVLLCALTACEQLEVPQKPVSQTTAFVVLQDRSVEIPFGEYPDFPSLERQSDIRNLDEYLGSSFFHGAFPLTDPNNIGFPVLNLQAIQEDFEGCIKPGLGSGSRIPFHRFAVSDTQDLLKNYLNYYLYEPLEDLKLDQLHTSFEKVFASESLKPEVPKDDKVFGYSNYVYPYEQKYIDLRYPFLKERLYQYVSRDFLFMLHCSSASDILKAYGPFVMTSCEPAAIGHAYFEGRKQRGVAPAVLDSLMSRKINYGFSEDQKLHIGAAEINTSLVEADNRVYDINFSFMVHGFYDWTRVGSSPLLTTHVDLSEWWGKLPGLSETHRLVLPSKGSLIPLSWFVEEENLRKQMEMQMVTGIDKTSLQEPYICLVPNVEKSQVTARLVTRRNEKFDIRTRTYHAPSNSMSSEDLILMEYQAISALFPDLTVVAMAPSHGTVPTRSSILARNDALEQGVSIAQYQDEDFNLTSMKKFVSEENGKTYLLTTNAAGDKVAYVLYDNYIIDDYTFSDLVESLETENQLTLGQIRAQYRLIAL